MGVHTREPARWRYLVPTPPSSVYRNTQDKYHAFDLAFLVRRAKLLGLWSAEDWDVTPDGTARLLAPMHMDVDLVASAWSDVETYPADSPQCTQ